MNAIPQYRSETEFKAPRGVERISVCSVTGLTAVDDCPEPIEVYFLAGQTPTEDCPLHSKDGIAGKIIESLKDVAEEDDR
jgi:membrane carboxypeptidase/penicillin-binding protein